MGKRWCRSHPPRRNMFRSLMKGRIWAHYLMLTGRLSFGKLVARAGHREPPFRANAVIKYILRHAPLLAKFFQRGSAVVQTVRRISSFSYQKMTNKNKTPTRSMACSKSYLFSHIRCNSWTLVITALMKSAIAPTLFQMP